MNRIEAIKDIRGKLKFLHLITSNEMLSRVLGSYLEVETFYIKFINECFNLSLKTSSFFPDLEQPFEIYDVNKGILINIMLENNECDLLEVVDAYEHMKSTSKSSKELDFFVFMVGISKVKFRKINSDVINLMRSRGRIITMDDLLDYVSKIRDIDTLLNLIEIIDGYANEPISLMKKYNNDLIEILKYIRVQNNLDVPSLTILPKKLTGYVDNLMSFSETKGIEPEVYESIVEYYSSICFLDCSIYELLNSVYSYVRKYWVISDNDLRNPITITISQIISLIGEDLVNSGVILDKNLAEKYANTLVSEGILREKISLVYF